MAVWVGIGSKVFITVSTNYVMKMKQLEQQQQLHTSELNTLQTYGCSLIEKVQPLQEA